METGSWLNRSDRSATEHLLCQTAGPLWKKIISKLLQEADACQKMLSVKVRLLGCCLSPPLSSLCHTFTVIPFIRLPSLRLCFCCFYFSNNAFLDQVAVSLVSLELVVSATGRMFCTSSVRDKTHCAYRWKKQNNRKFSFGKLIS